MSRPLRWYLPEVVYEITTRTLQERFLLRPGVTERLLILGVIGRGLALYQAIRLHAFTFLSNHMHMLASAADPAQLAAFTGYVNGNVARVIGRLHQWRGPFWSSRARVIPVLDDASVIGRLRYILAHGVKELLVERSEDWPGACSTPGLLGQRMEGTWLRRGARGVSGQAECVERYEVPLTAIPPWHTLDVAEIVARTRAMLDDIAETERAKRVAPVAGVAAVLAQDPHDRPAAPSQRRAPRCHASTPLMRRAYREAYVQFVESYRRASALARTAPATTVASFPPGSFPRTAGFVAATTALPPWSPELALGSWMPPCDAPVAPRCSEITTWQTARRAAPPPGSPRGSPEPPPRVPLATSLPRPASAPPAPQRLPGCARAESG